MTDFVNRLLGRDDAPPIRPVVASLFEPFAPADPESPLLSAGTLSDWHADPPGTIESTPTGPANPIATPATRERLAGPSAAVAPARAATVVLPRLPATTAKREQLAVPAVPVRSAEAGTPADPQPWAPAAVSPEGRIEPIGPRVTAPTTAAPRPAPGRSSAVVVRAPVLQPARRTPQVGHPVTPSASSYSVHAVGSTVPVGVRRAAAGAPDVHISIGRVEVRAAAEPVAPPREEQRKQPVLSLDDYLRGRSGGDPR